MKYTVCTNCAHNEWYKCRSIHRECQSVTPARTVSDGTPQWHAAGCGGVGPFKAAARAAAVAHPVRFGAWGGCGWLSWGLAQAHPVWTPLPRDAPPRLAVAATPPSPFFPLSPFLPSPRPPLGPSCSSPHCVAVSFPAADAGLLWVLLSPHCLCTAGWLASVNPFPPRLPIAPRLPLSLLLRPPLAAPCLAATML